jgi:hypothetical protein
MPPKAHGGYRKPANPAPVSGPGAMSRRTDGKQPAMRLPDAAYGEQSTFQAAQQGAPMAQVQSGGNVPQGPSQGQGEPVQVTPFGAPTQNPDEPVTAGAALGPGPGPAAMGLAPDPMVQMDQRDAQRLAPYLPVWEYWANKPGASDAMKAYVRTIKANLIQ